MPTLEEIARLAQVSRSTVSRVINNDPNVSQKTRERVQQVIQQLNFQPNRAARRLAGGRTHILGLVMPTSVHRLFTDPYFPLLIQGVTSVCNAQDYTLMLWLAEPEFEQQMIGQILQNSLIDGVIIASNVFDDPLVQALRSSPLPSIQIGRPRRQVETSYVDVDNRSAAQEAVSLLLRSGRRRVASIAGPDNMIAGVDRREGYLAALQEHGLQPEPELIAAGDFSEASGYEAAKRLLPHRPDAIFAASDAMANGALRAIKEAGLKVPDDIALVGFDDMPFAALADPPLTTVRQPVTRTGMVAAETLIDLIEHPGSPTRRIILPTELVIRRSCGTRRAATRSPERNPDPQAGASHPLPRG